MGFHFARLVEKSDKSSDGVFAIIINSVLALSKRERFKEVYTLELGGLFDHIDTQGKRTWIFAASERPIKSSSDAAEQHHLGRNFGASSIRDRPSAIALGLQAVWHCIRLCRSLSFAHRFSA
jgi:hypothetical protein